MNHVNPDSSTLSSWSRFPLSSGDASEPFYASARLLGESLGKQSLFIQYSEAVLRDNSGDRSSGWIDLKKRRLGISFLSAISCSHSAAPRPTVGDEAR